MGTYDAKAANGEQEWLDVVFFDEGCPAYLEIAIVAPYSANSTLMTAAVAQPGYMARRADRGKFNRIT